jgi:DNA-binding HxlR family transcriptional regulator
MKRVNFEGDPCPVARALHVVVDLWSTLIIRSATNGATRFNDFQARLGVARNVLAGRLQVLVKHGNLESVAVSEGTSFRSYVLTSLRGAALFRSSWHFVSGVSSFCSITKDQSPR